MRRLPDVPAAYDRIAGQFDQERSRELREQKYLDDLLAGLAPGAKVLDLGCGTGRPIGAYLIERGFQLTAVDGSVGMLNIARHHLPGARLVFGRMEHLTLDETYAAVVLWDALFHVPREYHEKVYAKLARWIAPGGRVLLSVGRDEDAGFTSERHGVAFFYSAWPPEKVTSQLASHGFVVERCEVDDASERGRVAIVARRKEATP